MTFKDIPAWFWMIMIALFVVPMAISILRNGIHLKAKNKLVGEVELEAQEETETEKETEEKPSLDEGGSSAERKPVE